MSRNFGIGTRNIIHAGRIVLNTAAHDGKISFQSARNYIVGWTRFAREAKEVGFNKMECVSREYVIEYGKGLAEDVLNVDLSAGTAQGYLTSVNTVMQLVLPSWDSVSATVDCGIPKRSFVRTSAPITREVYESALRTAQPTTKALCLLCREFGLRSKEAALLDVKHALGEAKTHDTVTVSTGTKGGKKRCIRLHNRCLQHVALEYVVQVLPPQSETLVPVGTTFTTFRNTELRAAREFIQAATGATGLHELRAGYACERYQQLTGHAAPCVTGMREVERVVDHAARLELSKELGHGRIDVTCSYCGSMK